MNRIIFLIILGITAAAPQTTLAQAQAVPVRSGTVIQSIRLTPASTPQEIEAALQAQMAQGGVISNAGGQVLPGVQADAAAAGDAQFEQQKTMLLQKITFDRRPSTILKAWALPDDELLPQPESTKSPAETPAAAQAAADTVPADDQPADTNAPEMTDEEQAAAKAAAEAAKTQAEAAEAARAKAEEQQQQLKEFERLLARIQLHVTRGQWQSVGEDLQELTEAERDTLYQQMLASLIEGPPDAPRTRNRQIIGENNLLRAEDVIAITELCPKQKLTAAQVAQLGRLVVACQQEGEAEYAFATAVGKHVADPTENQRLTKRVAARLLFAAARPDEAIDFLPTLKQAQADEDLEALDLLTDTFLALHSKDAEAALLNDAWSAIQSILEMEIVDVAQNDAATPTESAAATPPGADAAVADSDESPAAETQVEPPALTASEIERIQQKALRQAVKLVPRLREELGQKWLADSFTREAERGRRILNGIGTAAAKNMAENATNPTARLETLALQQTAVDAVLQYVSEPQQDWSAALHLMAVNWLREAVYSSIYDTSSRRGPQMSRDVYGNYFWAEDQVSFGRQVQNGMPQAIPAGKLLDTQPTEQWLKFLEPTFYPTLAIATARLHLRVKEEAEAFPYIETLAPTHPDEALELVRDFLSTWADNHDPNSERRRTSVYMFSFGFNQRLSGIPLTRSHQERNLTDLATWVQRIRALPLEDIDESWISAAFTRVHSAAEVYRIDDLEAVFGSVEQMETDTLASLLLTMRTNLSSVWRMPQVQQDANTNRKKKDIEAEVNAGYETALTLCKDALQKSPDHWRLLMVQGALLHDLNNYRSDIQKTTTFATKRKEALAILQHSAAAYIADVPTLKETEYTVEAFNTWFYAALGDSQIGQITPERNPVLNQLPLIKEALASLPSEARDLHLDKFANDLFSRMSSVNPAVKFRYVREGLQLTGEREQTREARRVYDYYNDLVTEIQLRAELDGSPRIGHEQPFGVLVSIRHTKAIERESGGFSRYLQNQNSGGGYYYNNGRPNEDYRDKFEQATRDAVDEHFEVLSVTFEPENVVSRADPELGWRVTPYAYVLLKPRGPEVDTVPSLRLDLDFLDTTGYVVLPVETPPIPVDCSTEQGELRPVANLTLTQTLDEREADAGRLILEIKATAQGLVPELNQIVDLTFADFEVTEVDDNKLSVSRFDPDSSEPTILSERLWTVTLQDRSTATAEDERQFAFPTTLMDAQEVIYQRYDDADLKAVEQLVALERTYDEPQSLSGLTITLICLAVLAIGVVGFVVYRRRTASGIPDDHVAEWVVPKELTPFSVLTLLKQIERNNGMSPESRNELQHSISRIERYYFASTEDAAEPDLATEAQTWVGKAR